MGDFNLRDLNRGLSQTNSVMRNSERLIHSGSRTAATVVNVGGIFRANDDRIDGANMGANTRRNNAEAGNIASHERLEEARKHDNERPGRVNDASNNPRRGGTDFDPNFNNPNASRTYYRPDGQEVERDSRAPNGRPDPNRPQSSARSMQDGSSSSGQPSSVLTDTNLNLTDGQRVVEYMKGIRSTIANLSPPINPQDFNATIGMNDPATSNRLAELMANATPTDRAEAIAEVRGAMDDMQQRIPEADRARTADAFNQMRANADNLFAATITTVDNTPAQNQQSQERAQARITALEAVTFTNPASDAAEAYARRLDQEREAINPAGGPFAAFFTQLINMITNAMDQSPFAGMSAEQIAAANQDALTPEGRTALASVQAGRPAGTLVPEVNAAAPAAGSPEAELTARDAVLAAVAQSGQTTIFETPRTNLTTDNITNVQAQLTTLGFTNVGPAEGVMNAQTEGAVREAEQMLGMNVDGKIDPKLMALLSNPEVQAAVRQANGVAASQMADAQPSGPSSSPNYAPTQADLLLGARG